MAPNRCLAEARRKRQLITQLTFIGAHFLGSQAQVYCDLYPPHLQMTNRRLTTYKGALHRPMGHGTEGAWAKENGWGGRAFQGWEQPNQEQRAAGKAGLWQEQQDTEGVGQESTKRPMGPLLTLLGGH